MKLKLAPGKDVVPTRMDGVFAVDLTKGEFNKLMMQPGEDVRTAEQLDAFMLARIRLVVRDKDGEEYDNLKTVEGMSELSNKGITEVLSACIEALSSPKISTDRKTGEVAVNAIIKASGGDPDSMTNREWDTYAELIREGAVDPTQRAWIAWVDLQHRWTSEDVDPAHLRRKISRRSQTHGPHRRGHSGPQGTGRTRTAGVHHHRGSGPHVRFPRLNTYAMPVGIRTNIRGGRGLSVSVRRLGSLDVEAATDEALGVFQKILERNCRVDEGDLLASIGRRRNTVGYGVRRRQAIGKMLAPWNAEEFVRSVREAEIPMFRAYQRRLGQDVGRLAR